MKDQIHLNIVSAVIESIVHAQEGQIYRFLTEEGVVELASRNYDFVSNFMSNEFGANDELKIGKEITLIKDDKRLLALRSAEGNTVLLPHHVCKYSMCFRLYYNANYIQERYDISMEELASLIREEFLAKTLNKGEKK